LTSAQATPVPAVPLAQTAPQDAAPPITSALPDQARLQALTRDLANAERTIEQLKADQQQMARENARTLEELRASQEELKQALARISDQKTSPPATQPAHPATVMRKPERMFQAPRARPRPRYPSSDWYYDEW
jgi:septal ring factor EnvC (AmiA/AmiB activator)